MNMEIARELEKDHRFDAFSFDFEGKFGRKPFQTVQALEVDIEFFQKWKAIDADATAKCIRELERAMSHELWEKYVQSNSEHVEEGYYTSISTMHEMGDIQEELYTWEAFLKDHNGAFAPCFFKRMIFVGSTQTLDYANQKLRLQLQT